MLKRLSIIQALLLLALTGAVYATPPQIPIGYEAYRQWGKWSQQRIGARAYMRSTYDRAGGNEGADASHFLYQEREDFNVTLDIKGSGLLCFARYNHWHGSPWHYEVDGVDHIVQESSSVDPTRPIAGSVFIPEKQFPNPLTYTWAVTKGADLSWVPIPFENSFRMAYSRTHYGTGYYIFQQFADHTLLSQPLASWDASAIPPEDVLELLNSSGTDLLKHPSTERTGFQEQSGNISALLPGTTHTLAELTVAPAQIRGIYLSAPADEAAALARTTLRMTWDNRSLPSVETPTCLFFGTGSFYNRENKQHLVKAFPVNVSFSDDRINLATYFPMPFFKNARIELCGAETSTTQNIEWRIVYAPLTEAPENVAYFHATYRDHPIPQPGHEVELLDTRNVEGGGDWAGHFIGTSFIFSHNAFLGTLEGDPRFYFDDALSPQAYGTGTEEWGGGGDYWGGRTMTLPFAGHPVGSPDRKSAKNQDDLIESAYRFLLSDLMPFGRNARITLERGAINDSHEHYETVAYWYGSPGATIRLTDEIDIGILDDERQHAYQVSGSSELYKLRSRFEWGVDHLAGSQVYPAHTREGRRTTGTVEFNVTVAPNNHGVLLRRTLDYAYPNQQAEVYVKNSDNGGEWQSAGTWYTAGSNMCYYSNPPGEADSTDPIIQVSNRRFREDEFIIPANLTKDDSRMSIRIVPTLIARSLLPDYPQQVSAWTELKYSVYSFVPFTRH